MQMIEKCPELFSCQAAGRPIWQKEQPLETLEILDRMASAAYGSEEAMASYIEYTRGFRAALQEGKEMDNV